MDEVISEQSQGDGLSIRLEKGMWPLLYANSDGQDLLHVAVWFSREDDALVVQIDTTEEDPRRLRVYVNDGAVFDRTVFDARADHGDHRDTVGDYYRELKARLEPVTADAA
ncbi:hypothetical protein NONI108955_20975 [Nocardia ninae]|uniref:Uncharacterized protein n=1 Tax=Nocardia ninae NBRC 108245 TaxID=1210091 RepID=A0A511MB61_9NOCA|nr:hypothetical protein [Nocardia ninae]GEM37427.1 hypothetical protein NN4_19460 [Nocardia ninae NBRC 108245]